jgi:hypothetical protein
MLPDREAFIARQRGYEDAYRRAGAWFIPSPLFCFLPAMALVPFLDEPEGNLTWWRFLVLVTTLVVPLGAMMVVLHRWDLRLMRRFGVACPACGGKLAWEHSKQVAASGRCWRCNEQVYMTAPDQVP